MLLWCDGGAAGDDTWGFVLNFLELVQVVRGYEGVPCGKGVVAEERANCLYTVVSSSVLLSNSVVPMILMIFIFLRAYVVVFWMCLEKLRRRSKVMPKIWGVLFSRIGE